MTTWIVKSEIYDLARAREMVEQQRNMGYKAWIEDENGRIVDEGNDTTRPKHTPYELVMVVLFWGTAAIIGFGILYAGSFLAGD
jgi:hypothetical protein